MARSRSQSKAKMSDEDIHSLVFVFTNASVTCNLNQDVFSREDATKIREILKSLTKEIHIDRTYVSFQGSKFKKTFLQESGWNALCETLVETDFGRKASAMEKAVWLEAYKMMIAAYIKHIFEDLNYDVDNMEFKVAADSKLSVKYYRDQAKEWKRYRGTWQEQQLDSLNQDQQSNGSHN